MLCCISIATLSGVIPARFLLHVEFAVHFRDGDAPVIATVVGRDDKLLAGFILAHQKLLICVVIIHTQLVRATLGQAGEVYKVAVVAHFHVQLLFTIPVVLSDIAKKFSWLQLY